MADYTDAEFSSLLDQLAQLPVEDRASDLLKLLKTLLTKNVTVQDWNTLIRDIAPLYATMLGLNDCMVNLINKVQRELGIVTGSSDSALDRIIALEDGTIRLTNGKFDKTGGTITGPVTVTDKLDVQSLTVHGTTTTADTTHLSVKDAIVETNVGAETAESIPLLSGYVIHIGNGNAYGIVYDKVAQSVKLGLVEKTAEGTYRFQNGEGQAVALRADTKDLTPGSLAVWNGNENRFETKFQVAQDATRMTIVQRNTNGEVITAENPTSNGAAVPKSMFDTKMDELSERVVHKGAVLKAVYARDENGNESMVSYTENAASYNIAQFDNAGCLRTNNPVSGASDYGSQCVNIRYANKSYVAKVIPTTGFDVAYIAKKDGTQSTMLIAQGVYQNTLAQRGAGGTLKVGTPTVGDDATPKKYADGRYVAKRTVSDSDSYVYAYSKGGDNGLRVSGDAVASTIPFRYPNGTVKVGTPAAPEDAVNLEYLAAQLGAVTGASPYFMHNICIKQTVDNVVNTIRVTLTCTKVAKFTSVSELREAIVQLGGDAENSNTPMWYGTCKVQRYMGMDDSYPDSIMAYSGFISLWNSPTLSAWADNVYPDASYSVILDDTNWTVSDNVLNMVMGGTTA